MGKYQLLEPLCIFSVDVSEPVMKNMIEVLKQSFAEHIEYKKISKKQFKNYIDGFSYIPFYHLSGFHKYLDEYKKQFNTPLDFTEYIYGILVMDGFLTGSAIRMNKTGINDGELQMNEIGYELLGAMRIFSNALKPIYVNQRDLVDVGSVSRKLTMQQFLEMFYEKFDFIKLLLEKYTPTQLTVIEMAMSENMPTLIYSTLGVALQMMPEDEVNLKSCPDGYDELMTLMVDYELDDIKCNCDMNSSN